ncbi:MAG TPA: hypothetical protein VFZ40_21445 [Pyrinomonadaceae bacterium]
MAGATCFAQSTYKGLTPGKSTRAEVERVLGRPVNSVSKTLIEYKSADDLVRIYVQYSDESTTASVDRIELICKSIKIGTGYKPHECSKIWDKEFDLYDARTWSNEGPKSRERHYFGSSRYMLFTRVFTQGDPDPELRWAFYSKDLYDAAAPKLSGCTGTILGDWETNDGHLNIVRTGDLVRDANGAKSAPVRGTYSTNNGTFVGKLDGKTIYADWKDDTGTGKLSLHYLPLPSGVKISGDWERTTGTGPASGKWEGRCVNAE